MNLIMNKFLTDKGIELLVADFIVDAITERWERDFGEPQRWIETEDSDDWKCQHCQKHFYLNGFSPYLFGYDYCPSCGVRLLPPEEGEGYEKSDT